MLGAWKCDKGLLLKIKHAHCVANIIVNSPTVVSFHCQTMSQLSYLQYLASSTAFSLFAACSRYSCSKTAMTVAVLGLKPAAKHLSYFCLPSVAPVEILVLKTSLVTK